MSALPTFTNKVPRVALVITTCRAFMDRTLPPLYTSLERAQVPGADTFTFCEGLFQDMWTGQNRLRVRPSHQRAWDLSGMIQLSELGLTGLYDYIFTLPDTCKVGPGFWFKVMHTALLASTGNAGQALPFQVVGLREEYPMCFIGLWSTDYLDVTLGAIKEAACNTTKEQIIRLEIDGKLKRLAYGRYAWVPAVNEEWQTQSDPYQTGNPRWHRWFSAWEITKWTVFRSLNDVDEVKARQL